MSAVSGLLSSSGADTSDLVGEYQETIFVRNAKGLNVGSTLFGLMAKLKSEPADNITYNWFERDPVRRTVYTNGGLLLATSTTLTFADAAAGAVWQIMNLGQILRNDRTGEYIRITTADPSAAAVANIERNTFGDQVTGSAILNGDTWTIITLGKDEGADPSRGAYENPSILANYIQTFNSTVYLANAFKGQVMRSDIDGPLTDRRIQALEKISRDIEFAYLFGRKRQLAGTNGYVNYTGGIYDGLLNGGATTAPNILTVAGNLNTGAVTLANFNAWMEAYMTFGSDVKLAFCGPNSYAAVSTFANSASNGYRIMQNETVFGMHITTVNTPFGELSLAYHPLMKESIGFNSTMVVVDLPLLVQKTFEPLFLEPDIQLPGQDSYKEQYRAKLGLKLKFAQAFGVAFNVNSIVTA
jgi:hypothetical protein